MGIWVKVKNVYDVCACVLQIPDCTKIINKTPTANSVTYF